MWDLIFVKKTISRQITHIKGFLFGNRWYKKRQVERDLLDREPHAANISKKLCENFSNIEDSYVFAISGRWGEGKTDLLNRIEPRLLSKQIAVVWFRPWQYTEDAETLRRVFLKVLSSNLEDYRNLSGRVRFK